MISKLIQTIEQAAQRRRVPIWFVGGPVRDRLLGRPCEDWDLVCRHAKQVGQVVARKWRAKFITLDEQNRIYRVILPAALNPVRTLDFAELQGKTIEQDLSRRDFTINAMAMRVEQFENKNSVIDPFHGRLDLQKKVIRVVSRQALKDDPLRLLRAFRFSAQFGFHIQPQTFRWIHSSLSSYPKVAAERTRQELLRLLAQKDAAEALQKMDRAGLLTRIFPELESCRRTAIRYYGRGGVLKHSLETVSNLEWLFDRLMSGQPIVASKNLPFEKAQAYLEGTIGGFPRSAWLKLAGLAHDIGKPATARVIKGRLRFFEHEHVGAAAAIGRCQALRCSRVESHTVGLFVRNHMRLGNLAAAPAFTNKAVARFFRQLGEDGVGMVLVSLADHYTYLGRQKWGKGSDPVEKAGRRLLEAYYTEHSRILPKRLIDGHLLMRHLRMKPGPAVGKLLEDIQDAQAEGKVTTVEEALIYAKSRLQRRHPGRP